MVVIRRNKSKKTTKELCIIRNRAAKASAATCARRVKIARVHAALRTRADAAAAAAADAVRARSNGSVSFGLVGRSVGSRLIVKPDVCACVAASSEKRHNTPIVADLTATVEE